MGIQKIDEVNFGVYMWQMEDGSYMADDDRNFLSISSMKGDLKRMAEIQRVAHAYLLGMGMEPEGGPVFFAGHRKVTDAEYREQLDRQSEGLIADEYDVAAYAEELRDRNAG